MAKGVSWDDVRAIVAALPDTDEHASYGGLPSWRVRGKAFVWERPLRGRDRDDLGHAAPAPDEPILGIRVADEGEKQAIIAGNPRAYFTIPHFQGYNAVLVRLDRASRTELTELITDAWRLRAPKRLLAEFDSDQG